MKKLIVFSLLIIVVMLNTCNAQMDVNVFVNMPDGIYVHEPSDFDINVIRITIVIVALITISFTWRMLKRRLSKTSIINNIILIFAIIFSCYAIVKISGPETIHSNDEESEKSMRPTIVRIFDFSRW